MKGKHLLTSRSAFAGGAALAATSAAAIANHPKGATFSAFPSDSPQMMRTGVTSQSEGHGMRFLVNILDSSRVNYDPLKSLKRLWLHFLQGSERYIQHGCLCAWRCLWELWTQCKGEVCDVQEAGGKVPLRGLPNKIGTLIGEVSQYFTGIEACFSLPAIS